MFKQTLLAAAAAGLIAAGGLALTTSAASAETFGFGGPGWNVQFGTPGFGPHPYFRPHPVCTPVIKNVKWWDRFGYPHWSQVVVAQTCGFGSRYPQSGYGGPHHGPHLGW